MQMPLAMARPGTSVKVIAVEAGFALQSRLASMGLVPGAQIDVVGNSGHGGLIVGLKGCRIMLGMGMAHKIRVGG